MGTLSLTDYEDVRICAPWGDITGRWYGNRNERPILALHGWLDNLGSFNTLIPLLPDYLGVLCIDLPGHGRSSRLQAGMRYAVYDYVLIIARVMKEYKWTRVSLMGHSMGGVISFIYASLCPHMVDMVISLDILIPPILGAKLIDMMSYSTEKQLVEDERSAEWQLHEPPSYSLPQLRELITRGSRNSVPAEFAPHLLYRSVAKSQLYPDKFYFSRDGRVKFYNLFVIDSGLAAEMARRIKKIPYLVIKGSESTYIDKSSNEVLSILGSQNPHFEYHEVPGNHHVHLTNATECAQYIVPFIRHHRPPTLGSWSMAEEEAASGKRDQRRKAQERFFIWRRQKPRVLNKL
ncbi:probable serine hydrolase isoform X2 [Scaptodrosophila lebanonensis]|uniref:Probable serine hydrolase isoform X2 n=1 Tax=Drosophila lebanonensis TaxID=7225 RepID=A0A6J2TCK9_DROLE|nr:probable serine hydrolase isoform X2 [Scaptodrosophila lebanonensis]